MSENEPLGLLLSDDLIFSSRITGTGTALGLTVKTAKTVEALEDLARRIQPSGVLVDLCHPGLSVPDLLERLRQACERMPRVIGYGSHVDVAGLKAARAAGCDLVLPRSAFVEQLPHDLPAWLAPLDAPEGAGA
jgi:CheY-like chemotaxis protein